MDSKLTPTAAQAERKCPEEIRENDKDCTGLLLHQHAALQALAHEADNLDDQPSEQLHVRMCVNNVSISLRSEPVVCVVGQCGIGKSFHLNALLRSTEIPKAEYERQQTPIKLEGEIWGKSRTQGPSDCSLTQEHGASAGEGDPDLVIREPEDGAFQPNGCLEDDAPCGVESEEQCEIVSHCDPDIPPLPSRGSLAGRYSFLLPSRSGPGTTTHPAISLQHSCGMYHFALRYCGEQELISKLRSFPWQDYTRRAPLSMQEKGWLPHSQRLYRRHMRRLLHSVRVRPSATPKTAASSCSQELRDLLPGEEICIKPELKLFLGKTLVFKSHGTQLVHDRLYIRDTLRRELYDVPQRVLLTDVAVFAPCDVLRGVELVDTPGTTDADEPHAIAQLHKTLERADHVLLFLKRSLAASAEDRKIVSDQLVPRLAWKQTGERPVSLTVVSSTEQEMRAEVTVEALAFSQQCKDLNAQLEKLAEGTAAAARIEAELEEAKLRSSGAAIDIHEEVMDLTYQDVWTMVAEQFPQLDADEIMDEVQMMDTYPFMYMSLLFNSNFRNAAYDSSDADATAVARDVLGGWLEQFQLALERSNVGKLLDILTHISTDNTTAYDAALRSVDKLVQFVQAQQERLQKLQVQCKVERGENAAVATPVVAAVAGQRRQALESVLCSAQMLRCSLQEQKQQEEAERQQQEPRSIERRLMARRLMQSCDRGIPNESAARRILKQIMRSVQRRRSASAYRGSAGGAAALHRHMVAASAASTTVGEVQLPRLWKLQEPTVVRSLRLYSAVLTQELQSLTAEAAEPLAELGVICRMLRDRVIHCTMLHTSSHHRRAQFYATFPVAAAHTSAAAAAAGAGSTPAAAAAAGGGPTVAAQLADHLAGRTDGGAWAVQQLANLFNVPVDVYVAGRSGTPFHIRPHALLVPVAAVAAATAGGLQQGSTLPLKPTVGAPVRVAWSTQHGFIAVHTAPPPPPAACPAIPAGSDGRRRRSRSRSPSNGKRVNSDETSANPPSPIKRKRRLGEAHEE